MRHLRHPELLGTRRRELLITGLHAARSQTARSDSLGRAGSGNVEQLTRGPGYVSSELTIVRNVMASLCYEVTAVEFGLPGPGDLAPQVFPVWMSGTATEPAGQRPHVDNRDGVTPLLTAVYYARICDTNGGEIVIGTAADQLVIQPVEDELIAFPGDTVHAVSELRAGQRLSVVCNFYRAAGLHG